LSILNLVFNKGLLSETTVALNCVQTYQPYETERNIAVLEMMEGTAIQDSGFDESDGVITLEGGYMAQSLFATFWTYYKGDYMEFDFVSTLYTTEERWLVAWKKFTGKPNDGFSSTLNFTMELQIISKY